MVECSGGQRFRVDEKGRLGGGEENGKISLYNLLHCLLASVWASSESVSLGNFAVWFRGGRGDEDGRNRSAMAAGCVSAVEASIFFLIFFSPFYGLIIFICGIYSAYILY